MYKNQLQELAQRSSFNLPSYTCIREGPDHAPRFKAVVNFNGESFDSPHYCSTLRQAEHAVAEVALNSLSTRDPSHSLAARNLIKMGGSLDRKEEGKKPAGVHDDNVLGPVPSRIEVQKGMSELQSFMDGSTSTTSKSTVSNQLSQMLNHDTRITQSSGYRLLQNACDLLKTELSVQKMVASISSDKAVWGAIVSNKAVKDLLGSLCTAKKNGRHGPQISEEKPDYAAVIMKWILGIAISKFGELIAKFGLLVSEMFKPAKNEIPTSDLTDILEENVRSSVLLSVVILLIVVVTRGLGFDLH